MPHFRKMLQGGVVDFTPRRFRNTFRIHFCNWLSISVPCRNLAAASALMEWRPTGHGLRSSSILDPEITQQTGSIGLPPPGRRVEYILHPKKPLQRH
eukprot:1161779-Pelagomonas_calceolata.AAC.11